MSKADDASKFQSQGYNCAQSVALAFESETGVDSKILERAMSGFGSGMGTREGTCGALTAAILVSSLTGKGSNREIMKKFREKVGGIYCKEIKGDNPQKKVLCSCPNCVRFGAEIAEEMAV
ncbi:MAG: C_GCAxxG_C_C family protein [Selenomonadaceae bacterium]|nr:C_GCAxxG_C_C family protein [Selenomonadaceae bacterium]